jgi:hypothetical protein
MKRVSPLIVRASGGLMLLASPPAACLVSWKQDPATTQCEDGDEPSPTMTVPPHQTSWTFKQRISSIQEHYGHNGAGDFDIYLTSVKKEDLKFLFRANQEGLDVWPWIWTQPNESGPHHVFVGEIKEEQLEEIKKLKETVPNINILVISNSESVHKLGVDRLYELECGIVLDTQIELADLENRMIMLEDERIICFTKMYVH